MDDGETQQMLEMLEAAREEMDSVMAEPENLRKLAELYVNTALNFHGQLVGQNERIQRVRTEINTYIDAEAREMGKPGQADACRAARIAAFTSALYLLEAPLEAPLEDYDDGQPYRERSWETETRLTEAEPEEESS